MWCNTSYCWFKQNFRKNQLLKGIKPMKYLSVKQISEKWGISVRRVNILCSEKRIPGATKIGFYWAIPADAEKPRDARIKSGKYIKLK